MPASLPKLPPQQSPYVYSVDELRRLLDATASLYVAHSRLQAPIYRTLLLLLYGSGMRIGEALGLSLRDADLSERIIAVRNTKFFKTRLVPIGPKLAQELAVHIERRRQLPLPVGDDSPLFTTRTGRGWPYPHVITLFQRVRQVAGIDCPAGEPRPPRLHDLRHNSECRTPRARLVPLGKGCSAAIAAIGNLSRACRYQIDPALPANDT